MPLISRFPRLHKRLLLVLLVMLALLLLFPHEQHAAMGERQDLALNLSDSSPQVSNASSPLVKGLTSPAPVGQENLIENTQISANTASPAQPSIATPLEAVIAETRTASSEQIAVNAPASTSPFIAERPLVTGVRYDLALAMTSHNYELPVSSRYRHVREKVGSGDSLSKLFSRVGLSASTLHRIDQLDGEARQLRTLQIGEHIDFYFDNTQLAELHYPLDAVKTLIVRRSTDAKGFHSEITEQEVEVRYSYAQGVVESSFWNAGIKAGMSPNHVMALAGIFGWDIDFALDIRKGDEFFVLYEQKFINGEFIGDGDIVAAEFVNQGERFDALRHDSGVYYTPEGKPMRKTFLRAPVNFKYISSNFNPRRLHPVTGKVRPHNGIDYVARVGTPIMAAGDGKVTSSGYNKYNGNYVVIQHSSTYTTKYLHLQKRMVKVGDRIKQGETLGTLGGTGRVTGPHLHYEFLVHGVHKNPRTVELPESNALKGNELVRFQRQNAELLAQFNNAKRILLAMR